jgi:hypothetical protein
VDLWTQTQSKKHDSDVSAAREKHPDAEMNFASEIQVEKQRSEDRDGEKS